MCCLCKTKNKEKLVSYVLSNTDVLIEPYGIIIQCHSQLHLILLNEKKIIRHLNGTNNKILNNLHYSKTFTLLEDHDFYDKLEQYQTLFIVYQLNKMYTRTFTFMPAEKN